jgi:low temperature requirement A protein (LtrA)
MAVDHEHSVTPRELLFDLVFVFAFTQVTTLLADDPAFAPESVAACSCWVRLPACGRCQAVRARRPP